MISYRQVNIAENSSWYHTGIEIFKKIILYGILGKFFYAI